MTLHIIDSATVQSLQDSFSALFPYLRLDVHEAHGFQRPAVVSTPRGRTTTLADLNKRPNHAECDFNSSMSVRDFEERFLQVFGVHVEVFRRSGRVWLKTMMTDDWSLEFQNEQGRVLSEH